MSHFAEGVLIQSSGREVLRKLHRLRAMNLQGEAVFLGRREGIPIYREKIEVYWWNGHDIRAVNDRRGPAMHRPGEVVS